jgi:hypothetical protein
VVILLLILWDDSSIALVFSFLNYHFQLAEPTQTQPSQELSFETRIQALLTVFGAFLSMFAAWGQVNAFGTFQAWYTENQLHNFSPSAISWIGSLQLCLLFLAVRFVSE